MSSKAATFFKPKSFINFWTTGALPAAMLVAATALVYNNYQDMKEIGPVFSQIISTRLDESCNLVGQKVSDGAENCASAGDYRLWVMSNNSKPDLFSSAAVPMWFLVGKVDAAGVVQVQVKMDGNAFLKREVTAREITIHDDFDKAAFLDAFKAGG